MPDAANAIVFNVCEDLVLILQIDLKICFSTCCINRQLEGGSVAKGRGL